MRPCDFRLNCGHLCPFKVTFFPFSVAYEINIPFSVTAMIRNMPLYRACSHARGFVQGVIHAASNALPHVAIVSSRKPMSNFRADT